MKAVLHDEGKDCISGEQKLPQLPDTQSIYMLYYCISLAENYSLKIHVNILDWLKEN